MSFDKERFLSNVNDHELTIIRDEGSDRHIRFRREGTIIYGFDLITWSGHLLITGDCGTYVFQRIEDMFMFFRHKDGELSINSGYWSEKVLAGPSRGHREIDITEFSMDLFKEELKSWFDVQYEDLDDEERDEIWEDIKQTVLPHSEYEVTAIQSAMEYTDPNGHHPFNDFWEVSCREYTYSFLWCLHAIVWGINLYDTSRKEEVEA